MSRLRKRLDPLFEMDILNPKEIERRVAILAAEINDPRAAIWFRNAMSYFASNMDVLANATHRPEMKPRVTTGTVRGADREWRQGQPPSSLKGRTYAFLHQPGEQGTRGGVWWDKEVQAKSEPPVEYPGLRLAHPASVRTPEDRKKAEAAWHAHLRLPTLKNWINFKNLSPEGQQGVMAEWRDMNSRGFRLAKPPLPADAKTRKVVAKQWTDAYRNLHRKMANWTGYANLDPDRKAQADADWKRANAEYRHLSAEEHARVEQSKAEIARLRAARTESNARQLVNRLLGEAEGDYETALHQPLWKERMGQEYRTFDPAGRRPRLPRHEPTAEETPKWAQAPKNPVYFFNPLKAGQRGFWKAAENLIDYLNYFDHARQNYTNSKLAQEQAEARDGEALYKKLNNANPKDVSLFLTLLAKAEEFSENAPRIATRHDVSRVDELGNLSLYRLTSADAVYNEGRKYTKWHANCTTCSHGGARDGTGFPNWCTARTMSDATRYLGHASGVIYLIRKDEHNYVQIAGNTYSMAMDVHDNGISNAILTEIAPLLTGVPNSYWRGLPNIGAAVEAARRTRRR